MSLAEDIPPQIRFAGVDDFLPWAWAQPERWELVDGVARPLGEPARMMTGGSRSHAQVARNALVALASRLGSGPCEALGSDFAVVLGPRTVAFPDVTVDCAATDEGAARAPVVIVEVLSPSTASCDLGDKATAYRRLPSLRHLLLVRQDRVGVQHFHRADAGEFSLTEIDRVDGRIALNAIGVEVPVAELCARVAFGG